MNIKVVIVLIGILAFNICSLILIDRVMNPYEPNYSANGFIEFGYSQIVEGQDFTCRLVDLTIGHNYTVIYDTINLTITYFIMPNHKYFEITIREVQFISEEYRHEILLFHNKVWIDYLRFEVVSLDYLLTQGD